MSIRRVLAAGAAAAALPIGAMAPAALAAGNAATRIDIPLTGLVMTNPCDGDVVTLTSGDLQLVIHQIETAAGGFVTTVDSSTHNVGGADAQGILYREIVTDEEEGVVTPTGGNTGTTTGASDVRLVSQTATEPNFDFRLLFHVTVNADGTETSSVEIGSVTCQT